MKMQKRTYDKIIQEHKQKIEDLQNMLKEKDKEIKMQALKIRELLTADKNQR
jgi:hypothetical protein